MPLRSEDAEAITRSLLGALAGARRGESVSPQVVLGPRVRPRFAREPDPLERRARERKVGEHGFGCAVRISGTAKNPARAEELVRSVGAALTGLESPGVGVTLVNTSIRSVVEARSPWLWPLWLRISDPGAAVGVATRQ